MKRVLVVDDNESMREGICEILRLSGYDVISAPDGIQAVERFQEKAPVDLVISDLKMDGLNGFQLVRKLLEMSPRTKCLMITAYGTVDRAVEALRLGASDFLMKPFDRLNLIERVEALLKEESKESRSPLSVPQRFVTGSKSALYLSFLRDFQQAFEKGKIVSLATEPGLYAELFVSECAREKGEPMTVAIHADERTQGAVLVPVHASQSRAFPSARCVVILKSQSYESAGSDLAIPPLRHRREDMPALATEIARGERERLGARAELSDEGIAWLSEQPWRGNLVELETVLRMVFERLGSSRRLGPAELETELKAYRAETFRRFGVNIATAPLDEVLESLERQLITEAYTASDRVKTETAKRLGIKTSALYYKLEKYDLA